MLPENHNMEFEITKISERDHYILVEIRYPNCGHLDGWKTILFETDLSMEEVKKLPELDPHFTFDDDDPRVVARFHPSSEGWDMGLRALEHYSRKTRITQEENNFLLPRFLWVLSVPLLCIFFMITFFDGGTIRDGVWYVLASILAVVHLHYAGWYAKKKFGWEAQRREKKQTKTGSA